MTPIDLKIFAEYSQKVPDHVLGGNAPVRNSVGTLVFSHWVDFWLCLMMVGTTAVVFSNAIEALLVTKNLKNASMDMSGSFTFFLMPFAVFNYFFFSYFMNHGQSMGMVLLKKRIRLESKSFFSALQWASWSTILCFSCGLSLIFTKDIWNQYQEHDHLYNELIAHKDDASINLLETIDKWQEELPPVFEEEDWQKAA